MRADAGHPNAAAVGGRLAAAIVGGYLFSSAAAALIAVTLPLAVGSSRADAALAAGMSAFLIYLAAAIWSFAAPRLLYPNLVLFAGAALMFLAARGMMSPA